MKIEIRLAEGFLIRMTGRLPIRAISLITSSCLGLAGCSSAKTANGVMGSLHALATGTRVMLTDNSPNALGHAYAEGKRKYDSAQETNTGRVFFNSKLKFQDAILRADLPEASRHLKPEYVNTEVKDVTLIHYAAARGDVQIVNLLISEGANTGYRFKGNSLAYISASFGHTATAQVLADAGGGTQSDIYAGRQVFAANQAAQKRQSEASSMLAIAFVGALAKVSQSGGAAQGGGRIGYNRFFDPYSWSPFNLSNAQANDIARTGSLNLSQISILH